MPQRKSWTVKTRQKTSWNANSAWDPPAGQNKSKRARRHASKRANKRGEKKDDEHATTQTREDANPTVSKQKPVVDDMIASLITEPDAVQASRVYLFQRNVGRVYITVMTYFHIFNAAEKLQSFSSPFFVWAILDCIGQSFRRGLIYFKREQPVPLPDFQGVLRNTCLPADFSREGYELHYDTLRIADCCVWDTSFVGTNTIHGQNISEVPEMPWNTDMNPGAALPWPPDNTWSRRVCPVATCPVYLSYFSTHLTVSELSFMALGYMLSLMNPPQCTFTHAVRRSIALVWGWPLRAAFALNNRYECLRKAFTRIPSPAVVDYVRRFIAENNLAFNNGYDLIVAHMTSNRFRALSGLLSMGIIGDLISRFEGEVRNLPLKVIHMSSQTCAFTADSVPTVIIPANYFRAFFSASVETAISAVLPFKLEKTSVNMAVNFLIRVMLPRGDRHANENNLIDGSPLHNEVTARYQSHIGRTFCTALEAFILNMSLNYVKSVRRSTAN